MARKTGLGKGLDALLPGNEWDAGESAGGAAGTDPSAGRQEGGAAGKGGTSAGAVIRLSPDKLRPNPNQPRKNFDEAELRELADSIRDYGIIQPVIAADAKDGTYIIIAGERRTRAARLAGLDEVPAILREYTDEKRMEVSLIENIHRANLNPIEEASAYKNLMDFSQLSQDEVASRVGKNRSTVANALRLLKLPAVMQKSVEAGEISPGHARALLSVDGKTAQEKLYKEILSSEISVRETERRAAALNGSGAEGGAKGRGGAGEKPATKRAPELGAMEEKFIGRLGTKVIIEGDLNKGRIHIDYYSMEDLERLYEILGG
ncbi:MAG: ParB/RepB/Spo0J family partition protein [Treponema sp.]|nr:ParB/RepB/Spo0J family partition protein [Treponema sp.]